MFKPLPPVPESSSGPQMDVDWVMVENQGQADVQGGNRLKRLFRRRLNVNWVYQPPIAYALVISCNWLTCGNNTESVLSMLEFPASWLPLWLPNYSISRSIHIKYIADEPRSPHLLPHPESWTAKSCASRDMRGHARPSISQSATSRQRFPATDTKTNTVGQVARRL